MFDSLRDQPDGEPSLNAESGIVGDPTFDISPARPSPGGLFLGMTAAQRLIIAVLLLIAVCALGTMCLMITGRIGFF